ncbi:MAG: 3'-5' exonuclease [Gemmatimonadota bacterium]
MKDVMVDLETMGTGYRAAIVSIGAVRFNPMSHEQGPKFYRTISLESCQAAGQSIDARTVLWWMNQEEAGRLEIIKAYGGLDLEMALAEFAGFLGAKARVWGNGSNFDNRILREAYDLLRVECPWHYRDDRDMRTVVALAKLLGFNGASIAHGGTKHHALHDAVYQATVVSTLCEWIAGLTSP